MDDPNITMEEYIRLEEEKARRHGNVYNWETATYGRIWDDDEVHNLRSVETKFLAIVFDDTFISQVALSCEPTVSPLKENEIDFRISFDESDDEDYTVIFDKNSFSYKIIYVDDLKTDSENDNDKVNMPSFPSLEPTVSYFDDLDYFKDLEKEFPAIVYNDALTSKLDFLAEPPVSPQHVDKFNLKDKTSLSEYDEEEQNVLYFNDLFPFSVIYPDDSKSNKDNDDKPWGMVDSVNEFAQYDVLDKFQYGVSNMTPLPPRAQRHPWLRYQVEGYTEEIVHDFEQRLDTVFGRPVHLVHVLDFARLTEEVRQTLVDRLRMVYIEDEGQELFTSHTWRRLFEIRGSLVFMLEFFSTCRISDAKLGLDKADTLCFQLGGARRRMTWRQFILALGLHTSEEMAEDGFEAYWLGSTRAIPDKGDLRNYWIEVSLDGDFLGVAPSYVYIRDPVRRLCHIKISYNISSRGQAPKKYLFRHAEGRKSGARMSGGHFSGRLAAHFGLHVVAAGAPEAAEDALVVDEGASAVPAPVQAP
ncbi:hypothetical protein Tco_0788029 [Tanacetum coccineum]